MPSGANTPVSFSLLDLPAAVGDRVKSQFSAEQLQSYAELSAPAGAADQEQYEIELDVHGSRHCYRIAEAACDADFLDLLDELTALGNH